MYVYLFIVCVPENCTCIQHMQYVCNACKSISEDEVMCIILIGSPVPGVQSNSFNIQIQPGMHAGMYLYVRVYIYVFIYIYYIRARDDCNRHLQQKNLFEKVTHAQTFLSLSPNWLCFVSNP